MNHAFPDRDDHLGGAQAFDELVQIRRGLAIADHVVAGQQGETGQAIDDVLIVIGMMITIPMLNHEFT